MKSTATVWSDILIGDALEIELRPRSKLPPVLCGVEIRRQN